MKSTVVIGMAAAAMVLAGCRGAKVPAAAADDGAEVAAAAVARGAATAVRPSGDGHDAEGGHGGEHAAHAAPTAYGEPGDPAKVTRTIELNAMDIAWDRKEIRVKRGETVRFVLVNTGELTHELTIGDAEAQAKHRAQMAKMSGDPAAMGADHDHPNAVAAAAGKRAELVWRFAGPGRFEFACNVLGHAEQGMKGVLIVE